MDKDDEKRIILNLLQITFTKHTHYLINDATQFSYKDFPKFPTNSL
jgi:hypothetical protein